MSVSPPVVVEVRTEDGTEWLLSFGGHNPQEDECVELTKRQCFWLRRMIMNIDPKLLERAADMEKNAGVLAIE